MEGEVYDSLRSKAQIATYPSRTDKREQRKCIQAMEEECLQDQVRHDTPTEPTLHLASRDG